MFDTRQVIPFSFRTIMLCGCPARARSIHRFSWVVCVILFVCGGLHWFHLYESLTNDVGPCSVEEHDSPCFCLH